MALSLRVNALRARRLRVDDTLSVGGPIDCRDQPIHNLALAVSARDAVCKLQLDNLFNQSLNTYDSPTFTGLTVTSTLSAETVEVKDPILSLAVGNPADLSNLGFTWEYNDVIPKWGGLLRDRTTGLVRLFEDATAQPNITTPVSTLPSAGFEAGTIDATSISLGGTATFSAAGLGTSYTFPAARGSAGQVLQTDGSGNLTWVTVLLPDITNPTVTVDPVNGNDSNPTGPFATFAAAWLYLTSSTQLVGTGTITLVAGTHTLGNNPVIGNNICKCRLTTIVIIGTLGNVVTHQVSSRVPSPVAYPVYEDVTPVVGGLGVDSLVGSLYIRTSAGPPLSGWIRSNTASAVTAMVGLVAGDTFQTATLATIITFTGTFNFSPSATSPNVIFRRISFQSTDVYAIFSRYSIDSIQLFECYLLLGNALSMQINIKKWGDAVDFGGVPVGTAGVWCVITTTPSFAPPVPSIWLVNRCVFTSATASVVVLPIYSVIGQSNLTTTEFLRVQPYTSGYGVCKAIFIDQRGAGVGIEMGLCAKWQYDLLVIANVTTGISSLTAETLIARMTINNCSSWILDVKSGSVVRFTAAQGIPTISSVNGFRVVGGSVLNLLNMNNYSTWITGTQVFLGAVGATTFAAVSAGLRNDFAQPLPQMVYVY